MTSPAGDLGVPADQVLRLVTQLGKIPNQQRDFSMSAADAWNRHRISHEILEFMVAAGLPARSARGALYFDALDLTNIAFHLGTGPANRTSRRFWSAGLNRGAGVEAVTYEIRYRSAVPRPASGVPQQYELRRPGGRRVRRLVPGGQDDLSYRVRVRLPTFWPELPPEACEVIDETQDLMLMWLPFSIATDIGFIRDTGLADCAGVSQLLVKESRRRGMPARTAWGLIVAPPFSTPHFWAEFRVGQFWVPVDPLLIKAMLGWGILQRELWHPYRSPGPILARIASRRVALASHDGSAISVSLPTYKVSAESSNS